MSESEAPDRGGGTTSTDGGRQPLPQGRRVLTRLVAALFAMSLLAAGAYLWKRSRPFDAGQSKPPAGADRPTPVLVASVDRRNVPIYLEGIGSVSALYTVSIRSQVDGKLERVTFTEGQAVKKGDILAHIDSRPFSIQAAQAEAQVARDRASLGAAKSTLARSLALHKEGLVSQQQLDDQTALVAQLGAQVRVGQALVSNARLLLDYSRITSPIDGVAGVRLIDPGNLVRANDPSGIVVITQLDPIAVVFNLPQDELPMVQRAMAKTRDGLSVLVLGRDSGAALGEGRLTVIDNSISSQTATAKLKAELPNHERLLWPNQFVKVRLHVATRTGVLTIPAEAVQRGPTGAFAYVVGPDKVAAIRPIVVDTITLGRALVASGLTEGELVVTDGQSRLRPGARVSESPADAPAGSRAPGTAPPSASGATKPPGAPP